MVYGWYEEDCKRQFRRYWRGCRCNRSEALHGNAIVANTVSGQREPKRGIAATIDQLSTNDIQSDEALRLAALRRYEILDTPPDGSFDRVAAIAADLFSVPIAIVSLVDEDRIWFKSRHGLDVDQVDRRPGLCDSTILRSDRRISLDASSPSDLTGASDIR
jgi:hypothetical protein